MGLRAALALSMAQASRSHQGPRPASTRPASHLTLDPPNATFNYRENIIPYGPSILDEHVVYEHAIRNVNNISHDKPSTIKEKPHSLTNSPCLRERSLLPNAQVSTENVPPYKPSILQTFPSRGKNTVPTNLPFSNNTSIQTSNYREGLFPYKTSRLEKTHAPTNLQCLRRSILPYKPSSLGERLLPYKPATIQQKPPSPTDLQS